MIHNKTNTTFLHSLFISFILIILSLFMLCNCGSVKYVYLPGETKVEYRDTTVYKDSIVYRPVEVIKEVAQVYDTLKMETSLAQATAYVDSTLNVLKGEMKNKEGVQYKYKYINKIEYRDSVVTESYPVEVEKEVIKKTHFWYESILWLFAALGLFEIVKIIIKLYGKRL